MTKIKQQIETRIEELEDYQWLFVPANGDADTQIAAEDYKYAAKVFKVPEPFVRAVDEALTYMSNELIKATKQDLFDIVGMIPDEDD